MIKSVQSLDTLACFRCGECCRRFQVLLDNTEAEHLARYLGLSLPDFRTHYADPRWPGVDKCLLRQVNGKCPFLSGEKKEFLCTVHQEKPKPCRDWAADLAKPECRHGLKELWRLRVDNAGILEGTPEDVQAFRDFLSALAEERLDS